jgi:hypothetical protein
LFVDDATARRAGALAVVHRLRGMGSLHLAAALSLPRVGPVVVTGDADLLRAAHAEGLTVSAV